MIWRLTYFDSFCWIHIHTHSPIRSLCGPIIWDTDPQRKSLLWYRRTFAVKNIFCQRPGVDVKYTFQSVRPPLFWVKIGNFNSTIHSLGNSLTDLGVGLDSLCCAYLVLRIHNYHSEHWSWTVLAISANKHKWILTGNNSNNSALKYFRKLVEQTSLWWLKNNRQELNFITLKILCIY